MVVINYVLGSITLKFDDVVGVILREEMQRKRTCETSATVLTMESRQWKKERGRNLGNHSKSRKGRSKSIFGKIECWNDGKRGHLKKDYRAPKKNEDRKQETTQESNVSGDVLQDVVILALYNTSDY